MSNPGEYTGKFKLYKLSDFKKLAATRYVIKTLVVKDGINVLFGEAKVGKKSFTGISMGCAVATRKPWANAFPTEQMPVLYVAAEGFHGLLRRQAAWEKLNGATCGDNLQFVKVPINLFNKDVINEALAGLKAQGFKPGFVVIDTLQRSMIGGDENDTGDMSIVFELAEFFRSELGATILIIHHTTKTGLNYRGSSVISGSADGLMQAVSKDLMITLICHGYKDAPPFEEFAVCLESTAVETEDGWENHIAVTKRLDDSLKSGLDKKAKEPTTDEKNARMLVAIMVKDFPDGATFTKLKRASALPKTTFERARDYAKEHGWITGGGGRGQRYNLGENKPDGDRPQPLTPPQVFKRDLGSLGSTKVEPSGSSWGQVGVLVPIDGCENGDTTAPLKSFANSVPETPDEDSADELQGMMEDEPAKPEQTAKPK
jgi:hypothetical protein